MSKSILKQFVAVIAVVPVDDWFVNPSMKQRSGVPVDGAMVAPAAGVKIILFVVVFIVNTPGIPATALRAVIIDADV
jgi:hypothetical protein